MTQEVIQISLVEKSATCILGEMRQRNNAIAIKPTFKPFIRLENFLGTVNKDFIIAIFTNAKIDYSTWLTHYSTWCSSYNVGCSFLISTDAELKTCIPIRIIMFAAVVACRQMLVAVFAIVVAIVFYRITEINEYFAADRTYNRMNALLATERAFVVKLIDLAANNAL